MWIFAASQGYPFNEQIYAGASNKSCLGLNGMHEVFDDHFNFLSLLEEGKFRLIGTVRTHFLPKFGYEKQKHLTTL